MMRRALVAAAVCLACRLAAAQAFDGLTLYNTIGSRTTYLKNNAGQTVNSWTSGYDCYMAYLLPDSTVWRMEVYPGSVMRGGPYGGLMAHYDWDNTLIESFLWSDANHQQHHDINVMPNGHVLSVAWARKTRDEGLAMGRLNLTSDIWPDEVIEWDPEGDSVAWRWSFWDHLVQDVDPAKPNYGVVSEHPELLDINQGTVQGGDWMHVNTVDYDEQRDEVIITSHNLHEFYVIDHSTTTAEAAGHSGGRHDKGGDFLYRWGNPQVYDRGTSADQVLFVAHGANWVRPGMPGAGNILVLNNGDRPGTSGDSSVVVEITPPLDSTDHYYIHPDSAFGPRATTWQYSNGRSFYSQHLGGAYRLPNGNTLATLGVGGALRELTAAGAVAWTFNTGSQVARASKYATDLTGVGAEHEAPVVRDLRCSSPARPGGQATVGCVLDRACRVSLRLYDAAGRTVMALFDSYLAAGRHEVRFAVPAGATPGGVLFARLAVRDSDGMTGAAKLKMVIAE